MPSITLTIDDHGLRARVAEAAAKIQPDVWVEVADGAMAIRNMAIESIKGGKKSGRTYSTTFFMRGGKLFVGQPRKGQNLSETHRASAPGEAPAHDTGALESGIVPSYDASNMTATVHSKTAYGLHLELGTGKIAPRPFMQPAADDLGPKILANIQAVIKGLLP